MHIHSPATVLLSCLTIGSFLATSPVRGDDSEKIQKRAPTRFIRVKYDEYKEPVALETATAKYVLHDDNGDVKLEVFLESTVHIADAAYYRGFDRRFQRYDTVLYELIAAKDKLIPNAAKGEPHPMKIIQQLAGESLGFVHQTDKIDYQAKNFVHSDLSPEEMQEAKRRRGEDEFTMLADMVLDALRRLNRDAANSKPAETEPVALLNLDLLSDPDGGVKLRRLLARSFDGESPAASFHPAQASSLIGDRNKRAMAVFQKQLDAGKRRIAFFWGAAHMPDFEKRLMLDYGMKKDSVVWRSAWDLREGAVEIAPLESVIEKSLRSAFDDVLEEFRKASRRNDRNEDLRSDR